MYPTQDDHYLLVEENLFEADADCGCTIRIEEEGLVRFFQCSLHAAAPELLDHLALLSFQGRNPAPGLRDRCQRLVKRARGEV